MANFVLEIFDDEGAKCAFYTVRWDYEEHSEAEKFFEKYYSKPEYRDCVNELAKFINISIGEKYGAINEFFRFENSAQALPPYPTVDFEIEEITILFDFSLRLYCLRISKCCVVLFNGALKTSQTAQGGDTSMAFNEANIFAKRILDSLSKRELKLSSDERKFLNDIDDDDITDILL